jgi:hypothetical protein
MKERSLRVLLWLRLVAKKAEGDSDEFGLLVLRKFVYVRALPAVGFTSDGQGFDEVPVVRVSLQAADTPEWAQPAVATVYLKDIPVEDERSQLLAKSLCDEQGWELMRAWSNPWGGV